MANSKRKCKQCKTFSSVGKGIVVQIGFFCSEECRKAFGQSNVGKLIEKARKQKRAEARKRKEKLKTRGDYAKEAQAQFNKFIRLRDSQLPCISCGRYHKGQYHAGHYRTVGACPELRFEELNCHRQCAPCNNHKSGNLVEYRINLVKKIGAEKVEWLEGPHEPKNYTIEELKQIKKTYAAKARELQQKLAA